MKLQLLTGRKILIVSIFAAVLFLGSPVGLFSASAFSANSHQATSLAVGSAHYAPPNFGSSSVFQTSSSDSLTKVRCSASLSSICVDAGYDVSAAKGSVTVAYANFIIPNPTCPKKGLSEAFFSVGIDGPNGKGVDSDFLYAGLGILCSHIQGYRSPDYFANYGYFTPKASSYGDADWSAKPGDVVQMYIEKYGGDMLFSVTDQTQKLNFFEALSARGLELNSASCTVGLGSNGVKLRPLVNFGVASFQDCQAEISGHAGPIGHFNNLFEYVLYNSSGTKLLAIPSNLVKGEDFSLFFE